jgi:hypothetical protein
MKRILFIIVVLGLFTTTSFAQDIITKKNGEDIAAKISEVTHTEVRYKRFDNLEGPIFSILKSEILMIRYANGTKDIFNEEASQQPADANNVQLPKVSPDTYTYTFGNPINPVGGKKSAWGAGIASLFIPGLGQFINGDIGGGFLFLGGNIVCNLVRLNAQNDSMALLGLLGGLTVNICSIINAAQIAKRVNIARGYQLANNTYLQIQPTIIPQSNLLAGNDYAYGMNFRVAF